MKDWKNCIDDSKTNKRHFICGVVVIIVIGFAEPFMVAVYRVYNIWLFFFTILNLKLTGSIHILFFASADWMHIIQFSLFALYRLVHKASGNTIPIA